MAVGTVTGALQHIFQSKMHNLKKHKFNSDWFSQKLAVTEHLS